MPQGLTLYTIQEVASSFRVKPRKLRDFLKAYPYYRKLGRVYLFTEADVHQLYGALECPSDLSAGMGLRTGTSAAPSEASLWTKAQALLTEKPPKRSGRDGSGKSHKAASSVVVPLQHSLKQR